MSPPPPAFDAAAIFYLTRAALRRHRGLGHELDSRTPSRVACAGSAALLEGTLYGLVASAGAAPLQVQQARQLAQCLRDRGARVISGFHSPAERVVLQVYLEAKKPALVALARAPETLRRLDANWTAALAEGRLLLLSSLPPGTRRVTAETAARRNRLVTALADVLLVAGCRPGGSTEPLCFEALTAGKPVLALEVPEHHFLFRAGAIPLPLDRLPSALLMARLHS